MFKLSLILIILFTFIAPPTSPPACSKAQTQATLQDAIDTLNAERSRILADFPDFTAITWLSLISQRIKLPKQ